MVEIGKPIILTEADKEKINEILSRPKGWPPLKIDEAMDVYNETVYYGQSDLENKVDELHNRISKLRQNEKVREYIELISNLEFYSRVYVPDDMKTHFLLDRMCEHPLYGVFERQAVCTVCGKRFSFSHDELQELIDSKKLIADGICSDEKKPYPIKKESLKTIRDYYLEQYNKNEDKESIEQLVWEHFCDTKKTDVWDTLEVGMDAIDNSDTKENSMYVPYPNEEEMAVAMQYLENTRKWAEQVEKGTVKKKTLFDKFKSIFRK